MAMQALEEEIQDMIESSPIRRVLVTVITYRRPIELERMLKSLLEMKTSVNHRLVIVDNDPNKSAESVVAQFSDSVQYLHEPIPGIAAARNKCLDALDGSDDAIVFLDDDEVVTSNLLDQLIECANAFNVPIVAGHVVSILPDSTPKWIRAGNYFQRRIRETGESDGLPATNNVLVRTDLLRSHPNIRFDHAFSATGGSDTDFFSRLTNAGAKFVWCRTALVHEFVQTDRVTLRWLTRRYIRGGETSARILNESEPKVKTACRGLAYVVAGVAFTPVTAFFRKDLRGRNLILIGRGLGLLRGTVGLTVKEYARLAPSGSSPSVRVARSK